MLDVKFGQKDYVLTILPEVEREVRRNQTLQNKFPWFSQAELAQERMSKQVRLTRDEKASLEAAASVLRGWVIQNIQDYSTPPSPVDCRVLAFGQIREAVVATDDLSMHRLAADFAIPVFHGHEVLKKCSLRRWCRVSRFVKSMMLLSETTIFLRLGRMPK